MILHVVNRAVRRATIFKEPSDYAAFIRVLSHAQQRLPVRILAYCVMPNHFHLVLWPDTINELSRFMQWLTSTHSKRWHRSHGTVGSGPLYQGRFKAFPVLNDAQFSAVCRYVERNALDAGLVTAAEKWPWCSLAQRCENRNTVVLQAWPIPQPANWCELVNRTEEDVELALVNVDTTSG